MVMGQPYGLPVQVCDTALAINSNDSILRSDVNREYFVEEHDRKAWRSCLKCYLNAMLESYRGVSRESSLAGLDTMILAQRDEAITELEIMARVGIDYESSFGKVRPNDTILKLQRTTPYYKRNRAHVCSFYVRGECTRGAKCPYRHEMPITGELSHKISRIVTMDKHCDATATVVRESSNDLSSESDPILAPTYVSEDSADDIEVNEQGQPINETAMLDRVVCNMGLRQPSSLVF
ncbi:hypothetical protein IFM89_028582 [Coptis chinensis]|uniref:C3H1-type domain-containing protein n=1 Tax=Coptis chinensis TaxID=261450 RepID=A0A835IEF5_9MAGN|nr:hypothetical protein IFM89_028582 [Coptis chinensis]